MWSIALLLAAEALAVALGIAHERAVRRVFGDDLRELVQRVRRARGDEKLARLRESSSGSTSVVAQLAEAASEPNADARAAEIDAVLADVDRRLLATARWAPTALRAAIVLGCVHAFWIQGVLGAAGLITGLVVGGAVGALVARIRRTEREGRADVDALVSALWGRGPSPRSSQSRPAGGRRGAISSGRTFRVAYGELSDGPVVGPSIDPESTRMGSEKSSS